MTRAHSRDRDGMRFFGLGRVTLTRRQRVKWWVVFHWRWVRGRGSRDGRVKIL